MSDGEPVYEWHDHRIHWMLSYAVLAGFAVRATRRRPGGGSAESVPYLIGIAGWLLIAEAVPDLDVLFRANLFATGPAWAARLAILVVLGVGIALAIGSVGLLRGPRRATDPSRGVSPEPTRLAPAKAAVEGAVEVQ